jgi:hypothetical protein
MKKNTSTTKIPLSNCNLHITGKGTDSNGNQVIKLTFSGGRGFSIQTNGNLPKTHSTIKGLTNAELKKEFKSNIPASVEKEICDYVASYGSETHKKKLKTK